MSKEYNDESIQVLSDIAHIQKRPSMYISTDRPSYQMWTEIMDNAVDEAMNGYASTVKFNIDYDKSIITIEDDGRGLPQGMNTTLNRPTLYAIYQKLNAGGKYDQESYANSGGLNGVGSTVVNALSRSLTVKSWRKNSIISASFKYGNEDGDYQKYIDKDSRYKKSGTWVQYEINTDLDLFNDHISDYKEDIETRVRLLKTLFPNITFIYNDNPVEEDKFINFVDLSSDPLFKESIYVKNKYSMLAFNWSKDNNKVVQKSYCNAIFTPNGGDHVNGIHNAFIDIFGDDVTYGLTIALSVNYPAVEYDSQAKLKAISKDMKSSLTEDYISELKSYFRSHPDEKSKIIDLMHYKRAEMDKRKNKSNVRRDRRSAFLNSLGVSGFADCDCKDRSEAELYIVEGNSAAGSAMQARDVKHQAILPLRGKFINAYNANVADLLKNAEVATIVSSIDAGIFQDVDIRKSRYDKIIIFTDADEDGKNISCLLMSFFIKTMPELVQDGRLYLALPPLYGTYEKDKFIPINTEELKNDYLTKGYSISRYKGLGEMNPEQLRISCMDPETRQMIRIDLSEECADQIEKIMGSDTSYRKQLLIDTGILKI